MHIIWPNRVWEQTGIRNGRPTWSSRQATAEDWRQRARVSTELGFALPIPVGRKTEDEKILEQERLKAMLRGLSKEKRKAVLEELKGEEK